MPCCSTHHNLPLLLPIVYFSFPQSHYAVNLIVSDSHNCLNIELSQITFFSSHPPLILFSRSAISQSYSAIEFFARKMIFFIHPRLYNLSPANSSSNLFIVLSLCTFDHIYLSFPLQLSLFLQATKYILLNLRSILILFMSTSLIFFISFHNPFLNELTFIRIFIESLSCQVFKAIFVFNQILFDLIGNSIIQFVYSFCLLLVSAECFIISIDSFHCLELNF